MERLTEMITVSDYRYLNALLIVAAFLVAAKAVDLVITRLLRRLTRLTKSRIDDKIIDILHRPLFYGVLLLGVLEAVRYLAPPANVLRYTDGLIYTLMVLISAVAAVRISNLLNQNALLKIADITGLGKDIIPFMENVWKVVIVAAALIIVLSIWNINVTPVLASAGIVGVAVALAAKDTLSNFFGGVSIFFDRPYRVGDYIVLEGGERGEVVEIGMRSTRIMTRDDVLISIPNSVIANTKIINESAPVPKFRIRIPVGVSYSSDIDLVEQTLLEVAKENGNVLDEPSPRVRFRAFGDSSLNFELLCWAKEPALRGLTVHELNKAIFKSFGERGITIPFPQRDVHLQQAAEADKWVTIED